MPTEFSIKFLLQRLVTISEGGVIVVLGLICLVLAILSPYFLTISNLLNIARQISVIGIIASGMTFAILVGGIDLSVGSTFAFTGCLMALLMQKGINPWLAVFVGLVAGAIAGAITGLLVAKMDMPPFVATLGMMSFLRGMALTITDGWPISLYDIAKEYPVLFQLGQGKIGQIPMQAICMIVIMGVLFFVLSNTPFGAIRKGIAYIPSDRKQEGLILIQSVGINTVLSILRKIARFGVLPSMKVYNVAKNYTTKLDVRCASMAQKVIYLSGGNQQKVVLSKSLVIHPKVMLMNEPTRGIDVGAKQEIYKLMLQLATEGMSIIFISSELPEIMALSDRILVIYSGKVKGEFIPEKTTKEELLALACGSNQKH